MATFVFIDDSYFQLFGDKRLMRNKETVNGQAHGRPCYLAIYEESNGIQWAVPISSQVEKYQQIYQRKRKPCDTIAFGFVLGERKAFLIQNMCPITDRYISNTYIDKHSNRPVTISKSLAEELSAKARRVLQLHRRGINVIFPDVDTIRERLLREQEKEE